MRKFRFIKKDNSIMYGNITFGKDYDIIEYKKHKDSKEFDIILINNDNGLLYEYYVYDSCNEKSFKDVTAEYRSNVINFILK